MIRPLNEPLTTDSWLGVVEGVDGEVVDGETLSPVERERDLSKVN